MEFRGGESARNLYINENRVYAKTWDASQKESIVFLLNLLDERIW